MEVDKCKLLETVIREVQAETDRIQTGLAHAKHTQLEAPGRMQSRYDTMGVEAAWVADGLKKTLNEKVESLKYLSNYHFPASASRVVVGCLVGLGAKGGSVDDFYFILPAGGGISCKLGESGIDVSVISPQAPIAKLLMGKALHDEVPGGPSGMTRVIIYLS
jgi:hypothetical protein